MASTKQLVKIGYDTACASGHLELGVDGKKVILNCPGCGTQKMYCLKVGRLAEQSLALSDMVESLR
tara:strand:- start:380 stop:577 length:198 start_codon:yes stop_codon:yes gene_type:complete